MSPITIAFSDDAVDGDDTAKSDNIAIGDDTANSDDIAYMIASLMDVLFCLSRVQRSSIWKVKGHRKISIKTL